MYMGNTQSLQQQQNPQQLVNQLAEQQQLINQCNWKNNPGCIFSDYVRNGDTCSVPNNGNLPYSSQELTGYNNEQFSDWLKALYNRNAGTSKDKGEAMNAYNYWQKCRNVPGYQFLQSLDFQKPVIDDKLSGIDEKKLAESYNNTRKDLFKNLQDLQMVRDELEQKAGLLQSRQDLYLESSRQTEAENRKRLQELDDQIAVLRRKVSYDFEGDLAYNAKIYMLGNITFYTILFIVVILILRILFK